MKKKTFVEIVAAFFILLFIYTALSKLYDPNRFRWVLHDSPLISKATEVIVYGVPVTELVISLLLFFPVSRLYGLYASAVLMGLFTLYVGYMMAFAPHLPCSCGGIIQKMSWTQHLLFNIVMTGVAIYSIRIHKKGFPPPVDSYKKVRYS